MTGGIKAALNLKARECANAQAAEILSRIRGKLVQDLSLATVADITSDLQTLDSISGYLTSDTSKEATAIRDEFTSKSTELFKTKTAEITVQAKAIVARVKQQIAAIQDPASFAQFQDSIYPTTIAELGAIDRMCPPSIVEAHQAIQQAWAEVQRLANESVDRFTREYGKIREAAATTIQAKSDLLRRDIKTLMTGLRLKGFKDIKAAETYLASNQVRQMIVEQIKDLRRQNPELADELELQLEVSTANLLGEIERGALVEIAGTGQQMVRIGKELFPKWEARKKEKEARSVQLVFLPDERTKGPNVKPDQIQGDIGLYIRNADGRTEKVRLFESLPDEDLYRFGLTTSKQIPVPRSYMTMEEFREFRKKYLDWNSGNPDSIKKRFEQARQAMKDHYKKRPEDHGGKTHMEWRQRYGELSDQYLRILKDEPVALLRRIDAIVNAPETEYPNGKGYVPEWQSHWTLDSHTVSNLERMARELRMQMELNAGMLDLIGHTGTGKDVLVRILACKDFANRPLFITDCTKWTTEAELAEDIFLGTTPEGGTFTYRLPSALLNGLQTEGAIIYLNEWTAMPHPAQIFLHGLLDEGRRITLKTQSGKVIEGAKGTLIIGSRNEDYPGLFEPGFATLNRVVPIRVGYPPLYKEEPTRSNPNPPFDPSEALRVARSVRSLKGFTLNPIPDKNIFIKIFDRKINGREDISIPKLTKEQEEDLETVVALVQFANNLRQNFALVFSKDPDAYKALPVSIPISGRELRWCAYRLSKMTAEEKTNPDQVARKLLAEYFVDKISDANDRQKVLDAMEGWSLVKRPATSPKRTK